MKQIPKAGRIVCRMEAYTDPAGKYEAGAPLNGNEDNFFVSDHGDAEGMVAATPQGILMAVADGMGGLNAGEVASGIAIDTVSENFTPEKIAAMASHNGPTRQMYLERIIRQADTRIKEAQRQNAAQANMGSTIVLAWLMGNELVVSWCGDSRAYLFNPATGLRLISHDHSYVQELVDRGAITYEQAFDHPQNNIVTRSLGDPQHDAKPESCRLTMNRGDILMLCSDGLSGVLRDKKAYDAKNNPLPEMNMEDIFRASSSVKDCREKLWDAASKSGWYDNVTAVLCEMVEGPAPQEATIVSPQDQSARPQAPAKDSQPQSMMTGSVAPDTPKVMPATQGKHSKSWIWIMLAALAVAVIAILIFLFKTSDNKASETKEDNLEEIYLNQDEGMDTEDVNEVPAQEESHDHPTFKDNASETSGANPGRQEKSANTPSSPSKTTPAPEEPIQTEQPVPNIPDQNTTLPNGWTPKKQPPAKKQKTNPGPSSTPEQRPTENSKSE